jgi:Glycosyl transferase family 2
MLYDQLIEKNISTDEYLLFLNSLNPKIDLIKIIEIKDHSIDNLSYCKGLKSFVCLSNRRDIYEIDLRFTWDDRVFEHNLYDFGWEKSTLLSVNNHRPCQKLIVYLCSSSVNLDGRVQDLTVPVEFLVGKYWTSIDHFYFKLPLKHPFDPSLFQHPDPSKYLPLTDQSISASSKSSINDQQILIEGGLRTKGVRKINTIDRPLVSIITVVFNGEQKLEQTIQSVIGQSYENIEYIIIDGGSTDRTKEIIQKYEHRIDYWKSEPDLGIYDAMNKAIDLATGQWLNFMNCGDLFYNYKSLSLVPLNADVDFYYSDTILSDSQGNTELWICSQQQRILVHQSIVYQKNLHAAYKYLVHDRLTISDYFFFRRNDRKSWVKLDSPLAIYNTEGNSGGGSNSFIQKLFVNFMAGDISELQMSLSILLKILRAPLRMIRIKLLHLKILRSARQF